ncbi:MAG: HIT family protein [Crocinitomicaceae bacterium]
MASIFTKIVNGELPCHKVAEDKDFLAFLDITPVREGHVLVIPKLEVDYIFDLEDDHLSKMMVFAKSVSKKIKATIPCNRVGVTVIGLEVPHAHIHLIPIDSLHDMDFTKEKTPFTHEQLAEIAEKIRLA